MTKNAVTAGAGFNRREMIVRTAGVLTLAGLGPGMLSKALAQTWNSVVGTPEETEGPYTGRTPHIHARVRLYSGTSTTENFTTQFFFDAITDVVYQMAPYNIRPNRDTINTTDSVYMGTDCVTSKQVGTETTLRRRRIRVMRWLRTTSFWI